MAPGSLVSEGSGTWGYFNQPTPDHPCDVSTVSINEDAASVQSEDDRRPPTPAGSNARRVIHTQDSRSRNGHASARSDAASDFRSVIDDLTLENRKLKEELRRFQQKDAPLLHTDQILEVKCHGLSARDKRNLESAIRNFATSYKGSSIGSLPRGTRQGSGTAKSLARSSSSGLRSRRETAPPDAGRSSPAASPWGGPLKLPHAAKANGENDLHHHLGGIRSHLVGLSNNGKKELVVRRLEQLFTGKSWGYAPHAPSPLALVDTSEDAAMTGADSREAHIDHDVQQPDYQDMTFSSPMPGKQDGRAHHEGDSVGSHDNEASPLAPGPREQRATRPHELDPHRPHSLTQNIDYIRHLGFGMPETKPFTVLDALPEADGWVHLNLLSSLAQLGMLSVTQTFIRNAVAEKSDKLQLSSDGKQVHWRGGTEGTRFGPPDRGSGGAHGRDASPGDDHEPRARKKQRMWNTNEDDGATAEDACPAPSRRKASSAGKDFHYKPLFAHRQHHGDTMLSKPFLETRPSPFDDDDDDDASLTCAWPRDRKASDTLCRNGMGSPGGGGDAMTRKKRSHDGAIYFYAGAPFYTDLSGDCGMHEPPSPTSPPPPPGPASDTPSPRYEHVSTSLSDPLIRWRRDDDDGPSDQFSTDLGVELGEWNNDEVASSLTTLETSGLAGVVPLDHFVVSILTRQHTVLCTPPPSTTTYWSAKAQTSPPPPVKGPWNCAGVTRLVAAQRVSEAATAPSSLSPSGPSLPCVSWAATAVVAVKVEYMSRGQLRLLPPVPPPPSVHILSCSSDEDLSSGSEEGFSWVS